MYSFIIGIVFFLCWQIQLPANLSELPVSYKGRFRPYEAYAYLWSQDNPHQDVWNELHENRIDTDLDLPLRMRLNQAGDILKMLPGKYQKGEWYSLKALSLDVGNFTVYSDEIFKEIQSAYRQKDRTRLIKALSDAYQTIAGKPYLEAHEKSLFYPSQWRLTAEAYYYKIPLLEIAIALYGLGLICFLFKKTYAAWSATLAAYAMHTGILALRCFILERPPVSNMFETVLYVPWIAMTSGLILYYVFSHIYAVASAVALSLILLILIVLTGINQGLDNVQAVLDSQYWLIVHVLMVVGSYGLFALSGFLGHVYLIGFKFAGHESKSLSIVAKVIKQSLFVGLALLIAGTLLGGVWAAQSWGRFWDWDPKESWAFISCCVYLAILHTYMFHKIAHFGLAIGSIIGLMAISFTWYGVNYVLGTGMHSYGFGSGGEIYYHFFLVIESAFICWALINKPITKTRTYV